MRVKVLCVLMIISIIVSSCSMTEQQEVKSMAQDVLETEEIMMVKSLTDENGITMEELIESGLSSVTYELFDPAEDGNTYVSISGNVTYKEVPVVATLQYKKLDDEEYEFYTLVYNDIPASQFEIIGFFNYLSECYEDKFTKIEPEEETIASNEDVNKDESLDVKTSEETYSGDIFELFDYTAEEIIDIYGSGYEETDYNGGHYLMYSNEEIKLNFVFDAVSYGSDSYLVQIDVLNSELEFAGVHVGMRPHEIQEVVGNPIFYGYNYELEVEETTFAYDGFNMVFGCDEDDSPSKWAFISKK